MTVASSLTRTKTYIRCGSPDCNWGLRCPVSAKANGTGAGTNSGSTASSGMGWVPATPNDSAGSTWRLSR
jgi:hypothetical protein